MALINIQGTLSSNGAFAITEGPVQFRSFTTGTFPLASAYPDGTVVYNSDTNRLYLTDGVDWNAIGSADGYLSGTIAQHQVAFGAAADQITGSPSLTFVRSVGYGTLAATDGYSFVIGCNTAKNQFNEGDGSQQFNGAYTQLLSNAAEGVVSELLNLRVNDGYGWATGNLLTANNGLGGNDSFILDVNGSIFIGDGSTTDAAEGGLRWNGSNMQICNDGDNWLDIGTGASTFTGSLAANQIAFGSGDEEISGSDSFTYNSGTVELQGDLYLNNPLVNDDEGDVNGQFIKMNSQYVNEAPNLQYYKLQPVVNGEDQYAALSLQLSDDDISYNEIFAVTEAGTINLFGDINVEADNSSTIGADAYNVADMYLYRLHNTAHISATSMALTSKTPYTAGTAWSLNIQGVAGNAGDGYSNGLQVSTDFKQTTNATPTTLATIPIATDNSVWWIEAKVVGVKQDGSQNAFYIRQVKAIREGTTSLGTIQTPVTDETDASWDCTFVVSGTDVALQVTGVAATTIKWSCTVMYQLVWRRP